MTINLTDFPDEVLLKVGSFTDNPLSTSLVCQRFKWVAQGCFERIRREVVSHSEAREFWFESVKQTFQFVVIELKKTGMKDTVYRCSDLGNLITSQLIPFYESYLPLLREMAAPFPDTEGDVEMIQRMPLHLQPFSVRKWICQNRRLVENVTELTLTKNGLKFLPPEVALCTKLFKLRLAYNELSFLPECIVKLEKLSSLSLAGNQLESLPAYLGDLRLLTHLSVCGNRFQTIPNTFKTVVPRLVSFAVDYYVTYADGSAIRRDATVEENQAFARMMQNAVVFLNLL